MSKKWYAIVLAAIVFTGTLFMGWSDTLLVEGSANEASIKKVLPRSQADTSVKLLPVEIKKAVNQTLSPEGITYPRIENEKGITIDVSRRATSVSTAVIDEKGQLHIVDYTSPIKE